MTLTHTRTVICETRDCTVKDRSRLMRMQISINKIKQRQTAHSEPQSQGAVLRPAPESGSCSQTNPRVRELFSEQPQKLARCFFVGQRRKLRPLKASHSLKSFKIPRRDVLENLRASAFTWWYNSNLALVGLCYLLGDLLLSQYTWQWVIRIIGRKHVISDTIGGAVFITTCGDTAISAWPLPHYQQQPTTTTFRERWRTESKAESSLFMRLISQIFHPLVEPNTFAHEF